LLVFIEDRFLHLGNAFVEQWRLMIEEGLREERLSVDLAPGIDTMKLPQSICHIL
jgi:hypothetical protein